MSHDLLTATKVSVLLLQKLGLRDVAFLFFFCRLKILAPHVVGAMVLTAGGMMQRQKAKPGNLKWERGEKQKV